MSTLQIILAVAGSTTVILGAIAAIYKLTPEREGILVKTAEMNVQTAAVNVTTMGAIRDDLIEDVASLKAELVERKREEAQYRRDVEERLAELSAELRAEKAEKLAVKQENVQLRRRVQALEEEVAFLRSRQTGAGPHA